MSLHNHSSISVCMLVCVTLAVGLLHVGRVLQGHSCQVTSMSWPYTSGGCLPALWVCSTRVMAREMLCFRA